ncbi:virulence-associated E family protein [Heliophilum fasciatum]|uniref:Putative P-loop ATPase n=1 Tax=Heliophilum fasciatum TaxID=35700 RepID=A0A4V2SX38_9FIRM|nr:virulence-associated E family protein [Heliophilum fasciatum]MCW2277749.1 putative P-loop ATPase [Heliophilum fasciatum]TCP64756.1 putative P-loop ATPase [Heliophilum fasciatum]
MLLHDRQITISAAGSRKALSWPAQTLQWSELVERLKVPVRGTETLSEYLRLPKTQQDDLKDVGGFVGGALAGHRRKASNVTGRDVISLDLDNIPPGGTQDVLRRLDGLGCAYAVYSTRKHEEAKPRLRVLIPTNRTATADEYEPAARKLASLIGMELCDPSTFEASRLMYWPSCSADSVYVYTYGDKPFLDADGLLTLYRNWRDVNEWPQVPGTPQAHVRLAAKQGNPTEKNGVVGAFCKTYDVYAAMDKFLPGEYVACDDQSGRYTYIGGSTTGGAIIYDNGQFLYSHHATDPAGGKLVNAFDMVRLHLFGEKDDESKPDTPANKLPSYVAMCQLAVSDPNVSTLLNQERYAKATQEFASAPDDNVNWMAKLAKSATTGNPIKNSQNVLILLEHDPLIRKRIYMDTFANSIMGAGPLPWAPRDAEQSIFRWTDDDDAGLRIYIEKILGFRSKEIISDALIQCAAQNRINPVVDYLASLAWDGIKRLDTLYIDYLGAADTAYIRAVTRKSHVAAVARAMNPGVKYDTMPVLTGAQGLGKTTLIQKLGRDWFSNSIESFEGKEAAELLQNVWIVEVGEMSAYNRSDLQVIKGFLSRCDDQYRAAYAKKTDKHPRRCVFFGTSNRDDYLRDSTGGRRFWPVDVGVTAPVKNVFTDLDGEIDQLWAEAVTYWRLGEPLFLSGELEKEAKRQQENHAETDPREGMIQEFVERRVPDGWEKRTIAERKLYWSGEFGRVDAVNVKDRDRICAMEIWCECLGGEVKHMKRSETLSINAVLDKLPGWKKCSDAYRFGPYGRVKGGYVKA